MKTTGMTPFIVLMTLTISAMSLPTARGDLISNPSMEEGFALQSAGWVADGWTGWDTLGCGFYEGTSDPHDGSRNQGYTIGQDLSVSWDAGMYQQMSSLRADTYYEVTVWFCGDFEADLSDSPYLNATGEATFSIGIDPAGGTDPAGVSEWQGVSECLDYTTSYPLPWFSLTTCFTAPSDTATVFITMNGSTELGSGSGSGGPPHPWPTQGDEAPYVRGDLYIDDITIVPEPGTLTLLGLAGPSVLRRRRENTTRKKGTGTSRHYFSETWPKGDSPL